MEEEKQGTAASAPMGMLNALLSNPELLQRVGSLLGAMSQPAASADATKSAQQTEENATPASEPVAEPSAAAFAPSGGSALGAGLGAVLSNPAMMEKLPEIMAMMKPLLSSGPAQKEGDGDLSAEASRERLLLALKPFLSPARCDAVDSILRISKLGAVFQLLK